MKQFQIARSNENWNGYTIFWRELGMVCEFHDTNLFFWDIRAGKREVDKLNQAELSMVQAKETV